MQNLPIDRVLPRLREILDTRRTLVLSAPPGSGKTTRVPPALLDCDWLAGRGVLVVEPRRLATRAAAARMAAERGEPVGDSVGYSMRLERRCGPRTRIEVVTEGLFTRRIQADPELGGVGAVLFDEFHERNLDADLGLALALDVQASLRPDLRLVLMSATLESERLCAALDAPALRAEARAHPVAVEYLGEDPRQPLAARVGRALRRLWPQHPGHVLVFLPGWREIRQAERHLAEIDLADARVQVLHGRLPAAEQLRALEPDARHRKIVLASAVAETSLTIEGVGVVVDAGLSRQARFDLRRGMTRLETVQASQASAEQRRGRAGRTGPGHCVRLWHESGHSSRPAQETPEILRTDLLPLALELAAWGVDEPDRLFWLDPPPSGAWQHARNQLRALGALNPGTGLSAQGRAMADTGLHPRLAHMLLRARDLGQGATACWLAALLEDETALRTQGRWALDLSEQLAAQAATGGRGLRQLATRLARRLDLPLVPPDPAQASALLALAYPDRIARLRPGERGRYRLRSGRGARLDAADPLAGSALLAVCELHDGPTESRILSAAALTETALRAAFADLVEERREVAWDAGLGAVRATRREVLDALVLSERPWPNPDPEQVRETLLAGIVATGLDCLPWTPRLQQWLARVRRLRQAGLADPRWPDFSPTALEQTLPQWLGPHLDGCSRLEQLRRLDLMALLRQRLDWAQQRELDELLPETIEVPSGSRLRIDYTGEGPPVLAVRLQEMFGLGRTPALARGRVPLQLHLLSPAHRPVQITSDLAGFWADGYAAVRRELRGRYPKHAWPEDPLQASPMRGAKPRPRR